MQTLSALLDQIGGAGLGLALLVVVLGSMVQASIGIGLNLFSVGLLVMIHPIFAPGPVLVYSFLLSLAASVRLRKDIEVRSLALRAIEEAKALEPELLDGRFTPEYLAEHPDAQALVDMITNMQAADAGSAGEEADEVKRGEAAQLDARSRLDVLDRDVRQRVDRRPVHARPFEQHGAQRHPDEDEDRTGRCCKQRRLIGRAAGTGWRGLGGEPLGRAHTDPCRRQQGPSRCPVQPLASRWLADRPLQIDLHRDTAGWSLGHTGALELRRLRGVAARASLWKGGWPR